MKHTILITDDEENIRLSLKGGLEDEGYNTILASSGEEAQRIIEKQDVDLLLLDIWMPGKDGLQTLEEIKRDGYSFPVIIMTGHGSIETAIRATRLGALDFIEKPLDLNKIIITINNTLHLRALEEENALLKKKTEKDDEIIGSSPAILKLKEQIDRVSPTDAWVLILGENGTGKELVARRIHKNSRRDGYPFVEVNCAAIPEELIESELFGHEKGAFTGADRRSIGRFEIADGGTLLLDEVSEIDPRLQAKLLRVLQEKEFERVGNPRTIRVDVRVIATTNRNLENETAAGRFREDLYFRLSRLVLDIPPLRERAGDIPLLAAHFLGRAAQRNGGHPRRLAPGAAEALAAYSWPGNIRELENQIERASLLCEGEEIGAELLGLAVGARELRPDRGLSEGFAAKPMEEIERAHIAATLKHTRWHQKRAAELLGIGVRTLREKVKRWNLRQEN